MPFRLDVQQSPARSLARRLQLETIFHLFPHLTRNQRTVVTPDGMRINVRLDDTIDQAIWLRGAYERTTLGLFRHLVQPGDVVVDVGAHIGQYSLVAAAIAGEQGRVYAVEPNPTIRKRLVENVALNDATNVVILPFALGGERSNAILRIPSLEGNTGTASLGYVGPAAQEIDVEVHTMDSLFAERPNKLDVIKIDVEGSELPVLEGAATIVAACKPAIVFEAEDLYFGREKGRAVLAFLQGVGYAIFGIAAKKKRVWLERLESPAGFEAYRHDGGAMNLVALHFDNPRHTNLVRSPRAAGPSDLERRPTSPS
jgi:FkbM family methyltransferase